MQRTMSISDTPGERLKKNYGEWAVVTGASSGIGLGLAKCLATAGINLVINARSSRRLAQASLLLSGYGIEVVAVEADLSAPGGAEKLLSATEGKKIGLLVNNAGYGTSGLFVDSSVHSELAMLRLNCEAVLTLTHYFLQRFRQSGRGGIIFLSSVVAFQGVPYAAHYAATKAYIQSFAEGLARECKGTGIDILIAAPGPVRSGFAHRANMKMGVEQDPDVVARSIIGSLGRSTTVVPGRLSKLLTYALRTAPRPLKVLIMEKVMGGFTRHQRG